MNKKRTVKLVLIILFSAILLGGFIAAIILIPRFVGEPPITYAYEVEFNTYKVKESDQSRELLTKSAFLFDEETVENAVSTSKVETDLQIYTYIDLQYTIRNNSESKGIHCSLDLNELTKENCLLEYCVNNATLPLLVKTLEFDILAGESYTLIISVKIDNVGLNALCEGNLKLTTTII